ncbi:hypothetical protein JK636_17400 [Clostridium sp. YIM B02515]|uniref:LPXTG cell wall anchor domain-containing protein n=1 Tax=Clostridium rhizosphaerae TaxID=2803861 RepID=A0ABS1TDR2_9CLOT|nr:hypothetical protein [Clostridium rhizosphaerae]MBL4937499.1 hypothetical protein [Clostridium rhizosphaerae]
MKIKRYINRKTIISFIAITIFMFFTGSYFKISAQQNTENKVTIVSKNNDGDDKIFSDKDGFWYPGRTLGKQFLIKNANAGEIEIKNVSVNVQSVNNFILNRVINPDEEVYKEFLRNLKVQLKDGNNVIFEGTFEDFNNKAILKNPVKIDGNNEKEFLLSLHFQEEAGNIFQDLQNLFNISIQYNLDDGTTVSDNITTLPKTGGFYNFITLVVIGLTISGIGFLIIGHKEEASLRKGGSINVK